MREAGGNFPQDKTLGLSLRHHPGTYALILVSATRHIVQIGKLGRLTLRPGFYVYVGSAFGPGGLKARVSHHARTAHRPHWHVDYVRGRARLDEVWYTYDAVSREHQWADVFARTRGTLIPLQGFGSSDCRCASHLFFFRSMPSGKSFRRKIRTRFCEHAVVMIEKMAMDESV